MHAFNTRLLTIALCLLPVALASCGPDDSGSRQGGSDSGSAARPRPTWVDDPASYYEPRRQDRILAVGRAPLRSLEAAARTAAAVNARAKLLEALDVEDDAGGAEGVVSETIRDSQVLAYWKEETVLYALVSAPLPATE